MRPRSKWDFAHSTALEHWPQKGLCALLDDEALLLLGGEAEGRRVSRSARFNGADSPSLSRTPAGAGNRKTWTLSLWIKRTHLGDTYDPIAISPDGSGNTSFLFNSNDKLEFNNSGNWLITTRRFRDVTAFMHVVLRVDTTQATAADRGRIYINGVQETAFDTSSPPAQNTDLAFNQAQLHRIGGSTFLPGYLDALIAECHFVDGSSLDPTSFAETDPATGQWRPKAYTGSYGTNGFYLSFADNSSAAALGYDDAGSNDWTVNNIVVTAGVANDSLTDVPTNYADGSYGRGNHCTWNETDRGDTGLVISNGGLGFTISNAVGGKCRATQAAKTGKWYWEITMPASGTVNASPIFGIAPVYTRADQAATNDGGYGWENQATPRLWANGSSTGNLGTTLTNSDVLNIAVDFDAGKIWYGKNGTWFGSGDPAAGTNASQTITTGVTYAPMFGRHSSNLNTEAFANFGQRPFAYTPPTGFKALNTQNIATPAIRNPTKYFYPYLYTGNGTNPRTHTGLPFQPDLTWIKYRNSGSFSHVWNDAVRGANKNIFSNSTSGEIANDANGYLSAFTSDGFSTAAGGTSDDNVNNNTGNYLAYNFKEGATPGFDIVTYSGDNTSNRNINHNLGVAPAFVIVKRTDTTSDWFIWHQGMTGAAYFAKLNAVTAQSNTNSPWGTANWSATQFMVSNNATNNANAASSTYVAYLFAEVPGFSCFGKYDGNAAVDGNYLHCGFRPAFFLTMNLTSGAHSKMFFDAARNPYNPLNIYSYANLIDAEASVTRIVDFCAQGVKIRDNSNDLNNSYTFAFVAFAEQAGKYARAR